MTVQSVYTQMKIYRICGAFAQDNKNPITKIYLNECNLHCYYCKNRKEIDDIHELNINEVIEKIQKLSNTDIYITGGEPLLQKDDIFELTNILINMKHRVFIETNGTFPVKDLPTNAIRIIHYKTPGSGMSGVNNYENSRMARSGKDIFRFVITSQSDYEWTEKIIKRYKLNKKYLCIISQDDEFNNEEWLHEKINNPPSGIIFLKREEISIQ